MPQKQRPKHLKPIPALPNLRKKNNDVTSDDVPHYNCIAFAYGVTNKRYWPKFDPDFYWPPGIPMVEEIDSFVKLFESIGYVCANDALKATYEDGCDKIVIYAKNGKPTHAAKLVGPNRWTSKLGVAWYDIEHTKDAVSGGDYGEMHTFMRRPHLVP